MAMINQRGAKSMMRVGSVDYDDGEGNTTEKEVS